MPVGHGDAVPCPPQHRYVVGHVTERENVRLTYAQVGRQPGQPGGLGYARCHSLDQIRHAGVDNAEIRAQDRVTTALHATSCSPTDLTSSLLTGWATRSCGVTMRVGRAN